MRHSWLRRAGLVLGLLVVALAAVLLLSARPGDSRLYPGRPGDAVEILVVSNGFHSGLILPLEALREAAAARSDGRLIAVATRFRSFPWIEAGWGDSRFYRAVPDRQHFDWRLGLRALFAPGNESVMHIVGVADDPADIYGETALVRLSLSHEGFARLIDGLDLSFARGASGQPEELGPGLSGPSLFYRGVGTFNLFNLCNHWTAHLLGLAGVPTAPVLATLPAGVVWDLRWRASPHAAIALSPK